MGHIKLLMPMLDLQRKLLWAILIVLLEKRMWVIICFCGTFDVKVTVLFYVKWWFESFMKV